LGGYQFLEKIVQIPFCIPDLDNDRKRNFVEKTLEDTELDPLKVYKRLKHLANGNVKEIKDICRDIFSRSITSKEEAFQELINVLKEMNTLNTWNNANQQGSFFSSPETAVENASHIDQMNESNCNIQRIQDEVLHWISRGIEEVLSKRNAYSRTPGSVGTSNDNNNPPETNNDPISGFDSSYPSSSEDIVDNAVNTQNPSVSINIDQNIQSDLSNNPISGFDSSYPSSSEDLFYSVSSHNGEATSSPNENDLINLDTPSDSSSISIDIGEDTESSEDLFYSVSSHNGEATPSPNENDLINLDTPSDSSSISIDIGEDTENELPNNEVYGLDFYGRVFQSMVSKEELHWFQWNSIFLSGKPRKIKRIINSYMVSRLVAAIIRGESERVSYFHKNLMKLTILLEQWPYRMAWMLLIVENLQQEFGN